MDRKKGIEHSIKLANSLKFTKCIMILHKVLWSCNSLANRMKGDPKTIEVQTATRNM